MKSKLREKLFKEDWRWALCWDGRQDIKYEGLDCACCVAGEDIPECNCICHKRINKILSLIKSEILKGMPKKEEEFPITSYNYSIGRNHGISEVRDYIKRL